MKIFNPLLAFNSTRAKLYKENEQFAKTVPDGSLVLDAGSGTSPYKALFNHANYESADFEKSNKEYAETTYVCDLSKIPVKDDRFDYIIFNQVMEHLPEPELVLKELNRVLKPSGKMMYTGPLFYEEHEAPYDYYRNTQFGLNHLFKKSGFEIERMDWLEGYFGTIGYQFNTMARYLPFSPKELGGGITGLFLAPIMIVIKLGSIFSSFLFHRIEMRVKFQKKGYPKNYIAILKGKPITEN